MNANWSCLNQSESCRIIFSLFPGTHSPCVCPVFIYLFLLSLKFALQLQLQQVGLISALFTTRTAHIYYQNLCEM